MEIITIRKKDKEDIYALAQEEQKTLRRYASRAIYRVDFTRDLFEKIFAKHFGKGKRFIGIRENKKIVAILSGSIQKAPKGQVGYIDNIFVSKPYRKRGYATILRDEFYRWLREKGIRYCKLDVLAKNPAKDIYEKWGFSIDGCQMTKRL